MLGALCSPKFAVGPLFAPLLVSLLLTGCIGPSLQERSNLEQGIEWVSNTFIMDDGYKLPLREYKTAGEPKSVVVALHGFNDYSNAFQDFCAFFSARDFLCIAYDQRGFGSTEQRGLWAGEERMRQDLIAVIKLIRERYPALPIYVAGESMGGAVTMTAMEANAEFWHKEVAGAILFAPAVWSRETQPWYQRWGLALAARFAPSWKPTGSGLGVVASDNREALIGLGRDPLVIKGTRIDAVYGLNNLMDQAYSVESLPSIPTLSLYGGNDQLVPIEPTCRVAKRLAKGERFSFYFLKEGYHMLTRDLAREDHFNLVANWLEGKTNQRNDIAQACAKF